MFKIEEIIILIIVISIASIFIGYSIITIVDKKLGEININIPETKVILKSDDLKEICMKKIENFENPKKINYITSEKFYDNLNKENKDNNYGKEEKKESTFYLKPSNYTEGTYYSKYGDNIKLLKKEIATTDITNIKPFNHVFK